MCSSIVVYTFWKSKKKKKIIKYYRADEEYFFIHVIFDIKNVFHARSNGVCSTAAIIINFLRTTRHFLL